MIDTVAWAFRRAALPLFWYYALTIGVPIANGSAGGEGFVMHAALVLTLPLLLVAAAGATRRAIAAIAMDCRRRTG